MTVLYLVPTIITVGTPTVLRTNHKPFSYKFRIIFVGSRILFVCLSLLLQPFYLSFISSRGCSDQHFLRTRWLSLLDQSRERKWKENCLLYNAVGIQVLSSTSHWIISVCFFLKKTRKKPPSIQRVHGIDITSRLARLPSRLCCCQRILLPTRPGQVTVSFRTAVCSGFEV